MLTHRPLIIVVSGYSDKRTECFAAGIDHYYIKPVEPAVLERVSWRTSSW